MGNDDLYRFHSRLSEVVMIELDEAERTYLEKIRHDVERNKIVLLSSKGGKTILKLIDRLLHEEEK